MGMHTIYKLFDIRTVRRLYFCKNWNYPFGKSYMQSFVLVRTMGSQLNPPTSVRGMKQLKKELFDKNITVPCLIVPVSSIVRAKSILKSYFFKVPNFRPFQEMPAQGDSGRGKILFSDSLQPVSTPSKIAVLDPCKISNFFDISAEHRDILLKCDIKADNFIVSTLTIGYENWKADEILRAIIPQELESVSGYSLCGHIVHLNLRDHLNDYKKIIGQVLLDKVVTARTVVNKTDNIDSTFRTFSMEILSGDNDFIATLKENNCKFTFDFSKVYWNSRLSTEHERIVNIIERGDVLYDVFCGVGPFSIPASKKGCRVLANDLNPESIKWLKESSKINKTYFNIFNKDGRNFILEDLKNDLLQIDDYFKGSIHIVMNLPGLAVEFLSAFRKLFNKKELDKISKFSQPKVYVYCFIKGEEDPVSAAENLVKEKLDYTLNDELIGVNFVRNVAPMKEMMRVTFKLSSGILLQTDDSCKRLNDDLDQDDIKNKRLCSELT